MLKKKKLDLPSLFGDEINAKVLLMQKYRQIKAVTAGGQMKKWAKHKTIISSIALLSQVLNLITIVIRLKSHL